MKKESGSGEGGKSLAEQNAEAKQKALRAAQKEGVREIDGSWEPKRGKDTKWMRIKPREELLSMGITTKPFETDGGVKVSARTWDIRPDMLFRFRKNNKGRYVPENPMLRDYLHFNKKDATDLGMVEYEPDKED